MTAHFPELGRTEEELHANGAVLDGEIVCLDDAGRPVFTDVMGRIHARGERAVEKARAGNPAVCYLFDCLYLDGRPVVDEPLERRRAWVEDILRKPGGSYRLSQAFDDGEALFAAAKDLGVEGIVAKERDARYIPGQRASAWRKVKVRNTAECLIVGYTRGKGDRSRSFGALHLAEPNGGALTYRGKVGGGFDDRKLAEVLAELRSLPEVERPVDERPPDDAETTWVEPRLYCEVQYASHANTGRPARGRLPAPAARPDRSPRERGASPMRSLWKGHIRFSMVTIPIRLYNAVDSGSSLRFNQLHKKDNGRVRYEKVCRSCGETLGGGDIVKGYEYAPDEYVIVEDEDFEKVKVKSSKIIEIEGFVSTGEVDVSLYDTPYFAGPDGEVAVKVYALLAGALRESGKLGVGRLVLRDREDMVLIGCQEQGLVVYKVRYPQFLRSVGDVPGLADGEVSPEELKLAQSLVDSMTRSLSEIEMKDAYHDAVREMIDAKVAGKEVVTAGEEEVAPVVDIMTALQESIELAKGEARPMERATGESSEESQEEEAAARKTA